MKFLGYVHTPEVAHHQWTRTRRRPMATGRGKFNRTARLMLFEMRWRKPPRQFGLEVSAWVLSILVHLLVAVAMLLVRPGALPEPQAKGQDNAIQVRFIEARPKPPPPPVPPQKPVQKHKKVQVARTRPSTAPTLSPVPKVGRARPEMQLKLPLSKLEVAEQPQLSTPVAPKPTPSPESQPAEKVPAAPSPPPPPRIVMEASKMALPPPKVELESQAPAVLPSVPTPPVPVAPSRPEVEISRPALSVDTSASASMQAVQAPQTVTPTPAPRIHVQASRPEQHLQAAAQQPVKVDETPQLAPIQAAAPVQAPMAAIPMAPVQSPQVHIEPSAPAAVDLSAPDMAVQTPAEVQVQAPPSPPVPAVSKPSTPAPASSSWAHQNDQFRPIAGTGGHGKAAQEQAGKGTPSGVPDFVQVQPRGNSDVMTRRYHRLDYKPTIFNQYWAPDNQDLFTEWLQKLVDTLSFHKTFEIAPGVRLHCGGWLLGFGCGGDPPPPPSAKSNDRRLNMAPAKPLVPGLGTSTAKPAKSTPPQSSRQSIQCETARVAGSPMPPGCGPAPVKPYQSDQWKPAHQ